MESPKPSDTRGYFMLPQAPEEAGYYTYGTPASGAGQYAHPRALTLLLLVERQWLQQDSRQFGIGNISLAEGVRFKGHATHRSGLEIDIRPLRLDGKRLPVSRFDRSYDPEGTRRLITLFRASSLVRGILFNDSRIAGVTFVSGHDDHAHIQVCA